MASMPAWPGMACMALHGLCGPYSLHGQYARMARYGPAWPCMDCVARIARMASMPDGQYARMARMASMPAWPSIACMASMACMTPYVFYGFYVCMALYGVAWITPLIEGRHAALLLAGSGFLVLLAVLDCQSSRSGQPSPARFSFRQNRFFSNSSSPSLRILLSSLDMALRSTQR